MTTLEIIINKDNYEEKIKSWPKYESAKVIFEDEESYWRFVKDFQNCKERKNEMD